MPVFDLSRLVILSLTILALVLSGARGCKKSVACTGRPPCRRGPMGKKIGLRCKFATEVTNSALNVKINKIKIIMYINEFFLVLLHIVASVAELLRAKSDADQVGDAGDLGCPGVKIVYKMRQ